MGFFSNKLLKRILIIVISLAIGVFCVFQLKLYYEENGPKEKVLIVKNDILPLTVIKPGDVAYELLPVGSIMPESIQDQNQLIGKKAKEAIYSNEQVLPYKIADSPLVIDTDERAVSVPVDILRSVGMTIQRGSVVDVLWIPSTNEGLPSKDENIVQVSLPLADDVVVIDVVSKNNTGVPDNNRKDVSSSAVAVLKFKKEQVESVITAVGNGTIYLAKKQ